MDRVEYWHAVLGIKHIRYLSPKEFNRLNQPRLRKTDCGRCNHASQTYSVKKQMSRRVIDVTILHELLHLLYPLKGEKWVDDRAELLAGYKQDIALRTTRKRVLKLLA